MHAATSRGRRRMPGSTAKTYTAIAGASNSVSEWLPRDSPKTMAAATIARSERCSSQATNSRRRIATKHEVERMCLRVRPDRPDDLGERQPEAGHDAHGQRAGQGPRKVDRYACGDRHAQGSEEVHAERGVAQRLEHDRGEPAQQGVSREAGRMRGPHHRPDRLQLAGVPEPDPGQHRQSRGGERDDTDADGRDRREPPTGRVATHHPSKFPQVTPHAFTATETTTRPTPSGIAHRYRSPTRRSNPTATSSRANGTASLLNR